MSDIDKFEKKFELHIEEDEESVQCLPEGAEHLITAVEGAESLSQSGLGSDSSSSESGMEMKGAMGGIHMGGVPVDISSESDVEAPVVDDLPDPTDILESNVFANPYNMIQGDEFSELPPPPPPPPGYVPRENIIDQYYSSVGAGSMQISGPSLVPPLPPARVSSMPQQQSRGPPPRTAPKPAPPVPTQTAYDQLQGNDLSDNSSDGENPHDDSMDSSDRLEALESLDQAYIVHHSDSSDEGGKAGDSSDSSSSDGDFEEMPGDVVRQRQLARHHVGVEVRPNRRYQNQINMHVSDNGHVYQNVPVRNGSHVYQNVSAMARDPIYQNAGVVASQRHSQQSGQQQSQQSRPQQLHQQHQGGVISNPYAESFGAQSSSGIQHSPSQPQAHSPTSPSGRVPSQGSARSSSKGSHSGSD